MWGKKQKRFRVILSTMLWLLPLLIFGNPSAQAESNMGVHLGLINSSASFTPEQESDGKGGMGFGVLFEFKVGDSFIFQPELNYVSRGYILTVSSVDLEFGLSYIELPLYLQIRLFELGSMNIFALFGPSLGFKLGDSCRLSAEATSGTSSDCDGTGVPEHSTFNLAFDLGIATKWAAFSNANLLFDIRYSIGASDIFAAQDGGTNLDITLKALQFWLGVSWPM